MQTLIMLPLLLAQLKEPKPVGHKYLTQEKDLKDKRDEKEQQKKWVPEKVYL